MDYFSVFSKWIGNLGVVPWLLFLAFLFLPIFTFLASLLFLVTLVLDTIFILHLRALNKSVYLGWNRLPAYVINCKKLHTGRPLVKGTFACAMLLLYSPPLLSRENQSFQYLKSIKTTTSVTLTKGEIIQIPLKGIKKYTVGNKEIIGAKKLKEENALILKAKSIGQTFIYFWKGSKNPEKLEIFVSTKRFQLNLKKVILEFKGLNLKTAIQGGEVIIEGEVTTYSQYLKLLQIYNLNEDKINLGKTTLSNFLKLKIYKAFLEIIFERGFFDLNCTQKEILISCIGARKIKETLADLKKSFFLVFSNEKNLTLTKRYKINLIIQQYENSSGNSFEFGLQKIKGELNNILEKNPLSLIKSNHITLDKNQFHSSTLAKPQLKGILNKKITVRIGKEINFLQRIENGIATQAWRFAGLGIDITLKPHTERLLLQYKTNLSGPGENGININTQQSQIFIDLNKEFILFDIGFHLNQERKDSTPFLADIPLFGSLFEGSAENNIFKKILCIVKVKEI